MAFETEYFLVDSTMAADRYVTLQDGTPASPSNVALDIIGGSAQHLNGDFTVSGATIRWDYTASPLYNLIIDGDKLRIIYDRS